MNISCAVLAGGESRRMGRNKALIDVGGRPLVTSIVEHLGSWSDDVYVVAKQTLSYQALGLRTFVDVYDASTPLAGILTALTSASHPFVFVCATDMPCVSHEVVELLASRTDGADAVVPERDGRLEPLHALWSVSVAGRMAAELAAGERAAHRVLRRLDVVTVTEREWRAIDPAAASFTNLNTPEELDAARRRARKSDGLRAGA
jgi:molybdopterin-guanine dinucleotide biosynthesis protein A